MTPPRTIGGRSFSVNILADRSHQPKRDCGRVAQYLKAWTVFTKVTKKERPPLSLPFVPFVPGEIELMKLRKESEAGNWLTCYNKCSSLSETKFCEERGLLWVQCLTELKTDAA